MPAQRPLVYLITDGTATDDNFESALSAIVSTVTAAVQMGVSLIQVREKQLSAKNLFDLSAKIVPITRNTDTRLLINDRADIARAAGADGVHLTTRSLPTAVVREKFGADFLIGVSTHSASEIRSAIEGEADFVVFGPVFRMADKGKPTGKEDLEMVCEQFDGFPVLGLGGVEASNFAIVLETKAAGFAAIRALNDIDSMRRIMNSIK